jgi:hypothetical protein
MKLQVKSLRYDNLPEEDKGSVSGNGAGPEYSQYLEVLHDGKRIALESDGMEPEDASFCRDLDWIKGLLTQVYALGVIDGQNNYIKLPE